MSLRLYFSASLLALAACGGEPTNVDDGGLASASSSSSSSSSNSSSSSSSSSNSSSSGTAILTGGVCLPDDTTGTGGLRVIEAEQYHNRLHALLGFADDDEYHKRIEPYAGQNMLQTEHAVQFMGLAVEAFYRTAETIASRHLAIDCTNLDAHGCGDLFIANFVEPLFQRTLNSNEHATYLTYFTETADFAQEGQRLAMTSAISSPNFIFSTEAGNE